MNAAIHDPVLLARVEKAFRKAFGARVPFHADLERSAEPRWTSLKHVEFLIAIELEFGVRFDGTDATDMISIQAVCARLAQAVPGAGAHLAQIDGRSR
jgi:acyl carrier protein